MIIHDSSLPTLPNFSTPFCPLPKISFLDHSTPYPPPRADQSHATSVSIISPSYNHPYMQKKERKKDAPFLSSPPLFSAPSIK